jgi:hypothetical protein
MSALSAKPDGPDAPASTPAGDDIVRIEAARYIADLSSELAKMARASGLHLVSYFLDMAEAEALAGASKLEAGERLDADMPAAGAHTRK